MESWPPTCAGTPRSSSTRSAASPPCSPPSHVSGPSRDERLLAALSHAGAWLLPVLLPLILWLAERRKSAYVASQAMQALVFQLLLQLFSAAMAASLLAGLLLPVFFTLYSERTAVDPSSFGRIFLVGMLLGGLASGLQLLLLLYSGVAILRTWQGADFRYPLIGRWIK